jgi:hypothetical protein
VWELRHLPGRRATGMPVAAPPEHGGTPDDRALQGGIENRQGRGEPDVPPGPPVGDGPGEVDLLVTAILGASHDGAAGWSPIPLDESDAEPSARVG